MRLVAFPLFIGCFYFYFSGNPSLLCAPSWPPLPSYPSPPSTRPWLCVRLCSPQDKSGTGTVWSLPVSAAEDTGLLRVGALRTPAKQARHGLVEHLGLFVLGAGRGHVAGTIKMVLPFQRHGCAALLTATGHKQGEKRK